jgi:GNAT superfamily N-acetyltransferase
LDTLIRPIKPAELSTFLSILREAADWLRAAGRPLWTPEMLSEQAVLSQYDMGELFLCRVDHDPAGAMILAGEEAMHWPGKNPGEATYLHKLAVRRAYAGTGLSARMLAFAKEYARGAGRTYLRLDCDCRSALCNLYERNGFDKVDICTFNNGLVVAYYQYRV